MRVHLITLTVVLAALGASVTAGATADRTCTGSQLAGRFAVVPGSAGAGNIVYALKLKNVSKSQCNVSGLPQGQLLGKGGGKLPTHVKAAFPGALTAILVRLAPGQSTRATARFSPDVPGPGEQTTGRCEPVAHWFRVSAPGGGTTKAAVSPPTSVCEHGQLQFSAYGRG